MEGTRPTDFGQGDAYTQIPPLPSPMTTGRDLGMHLDTELSMRMHISKTTQAVRAFFHLRRVRQVQRLLGRDVTANLVSAFVLSRRDYGNSLLAGLPLSRLSQYKVSPTQISPGETYCCY